MNRNALSGGQLPHFLASGEAERMTARKQEASLHPGDFLHVPSGTPHTFQLTGNTTRFIQFHAPGLNEQFFRFMCEPCEEYAFPQPPAPFRFDRAMQHLAELDVNFPE